MVWGLDGKALNSGDAAKSSPGEQMMSVDLRYNFPLGPLPVTLVGACIAGSDISSNRICFYKVNPTTRLLESVGSIPLSRKFPNGSCMYRSPVTGKYYYFVNWADGQMEQYELFVSGGKVTGTLVRGGHKSPFSFGGYIKSCVADDSQGVIYIAKESVAIYKYGAEPGDSGTVPLKMVDSRNGHLTIRIKGLSLYYKKDGTGYLIASSQGDSTFAVYTREAGNDYLGSFTITDSVNPEIDMCTSTEGCDVTNFPLGPSFPKGLFVAQDYPNTSGKASVGSNNFKYVPFENIASALNLTTDTTWDPRKIGREDPRVYLERLIAYLKELGLPKGIENSLCVKVENAANSLAKGNAGAARNQLKAFLHEVNAQADKKLAGKEAQFLHEVVAAITVMFD